MKNIKQCLNEEIQRAENLQQLYLEAGGELLPDANALQTKLTAARKAQADNDIQHMVDAWRNLRGTERTTP